MFLSKRDFEIQCKEDQRACVAPLLHKVMEDTQVSEVTSFQEDERWYSKVIGGATQEGEENPEEIMLETRYGYKTKEMAEYVLCAMWLGFMKHEAVWSTSLTNQDLENGVIKVTIALKDPRNN